MEKATRELENFHKMVAAVLYVARECMIREGVPINQVSEVLQSELEDLKTTHPKLVQKLLAQNADNTPEKIGGFDLETAVRLVILKGVNEGKFTENFVDGVKHYKISSEYSKEVIRDIYAFTEN